MVVSFIDLGSNSVKLSVFDLDINKEIYSQRIVSRLGQNSFESHILQSENIDKTIEAVKELSYKAKEYNSEYIEIVATSCVRDAINKNDFAQKIKDTISVDLKILSGEEEAEIIFKGVINSFKEKCKFLLVDIGGGSTEFILGDQNKIYFRESVNLGAVRLYDKFNDFEDTCNYVKEILLPTINKIKSIDFDVLIGSSGTWTNLYKYTIGRINNENFNLLDILKSIEILKSISIEERCKQKGINYDRGDIILAGSSIVYIVLNEFKNKKINVTYSSLKEGLLTRFNSDFIQKKTLISTE